MAGLLRSRGPGVDRTRGHSLIELVVAAAVVGIGAAIAFPRLTSLTAASRLESASRGLAIDLQKTRMRAIAEARRYQVSFDTRSGRYTVCGESSLDRFDAGCVTRAVDDAGTVGVAIDGRTTTVLNTRGRCETPLTVTLVHSRSGSSRIVAIVGTGYVDVY
jgi:prepilin-type N-terminal cleavage/methylation domain-containing protein